jgi:integrase
MGLGHGAGYTGTVWQRFSFVVFERLPVLTPLWTTLGNRLMDRVLSASTGLTQEELLSLRWRDIDLDLLSISVSQALYKRRGICQFKEPKTAHSRRISMTPKLALFLKEYRADCEKLYQQLGKQLALDELVFANPEGKPIDPCVLTHAFTSIAHKAGLDGLRFHDLRHTFASLMLLRGAKPKVISEALGHASVAFTMDVYSHIIEGMQQDAMALLDEVLPPGKNGARNKINANLTPTVRGLALGASVAQG